MSVPVPGYNHPTTAGWAAAEAAGLELSPHGSGSKTKSIKEGDFFGEGTGGRAGGAEVGLGWTEKLLLFISLLGK